MLLAGSCIDSRLAGILSKYWQHDALLQLLLHAVRVLMQYGSTIMQPQQEPGEKEQPPASEEEQEDKAEVDGTAEPQAVVQRSVGLPELLSAVQELGRVRQDSAGRAVLSRIANCAQ